MPGVVATPASSISAVRGVSLLSASPRCRRRDRTPLGFGREAKAELAQCREQRCGGSAKAWRRSSRISRRGRVKAAGAAMLGRRRWRDEEVLGELFDLADVGLGRHHPAEAPAGHPEVLREAVHHETSSGCSGRCWRRAAVGQALVDLVHDRDAAAGSRCRAGRRSASGSAGCRSGWPVRPPSAHGATRRPGSRCNVGGRLEVVLASTGMRARATPSKLRTRLRLEDSRVGQQPFVARIGGDGQGQHQRA